MNFDIMTSEEVSNYIKNTDINIVEDDLRKCSFACVKRTYEKFFGFPPVSTANRSWVELQFRRRLNAESRAHALLKECKGI